MQDNDIEILFRAVESQLNALDTFDRFLQLRIPQRPGRQARAKPSRRKINVIDINIHTSIFESIDKKGPVGMAQYCTVSTV